jgi:hypothetical protein
MIAGFFFFLPSPKMATRFSHLASRFSPEVVRTNQAMEGNMKKASSRRACNETEKGMECIRIVEPLLAEAEAVMEKFKHFKKWDEIAANFPEAESQELTEFLVVFTDGRIPPGPYPIEIKQRLDAFVEWNQSLGGFDD